MLHHGRVRAPEARGGARARASAAAIFFTHDWNGQAAEDDRECRCIVEHHCDSLTFAWAMNCCRPTPWGFALPLPSLLLLAKGMLETTPDEGAFPSSILRSEEIKY